MPSLLERARAGVAVLRILVLYWTFSCVTILLNKFIMTKLGFHFPILLTCVHFGVNLIIAAIVCATRYVELPRIPWRVFATGVVPIALFHCGDIVLSNESYNYLEVSFMAMAKTSVIPITFVLSLAIDRVVPERRLAFDVVFVFLGILLAVYGEAAFNLAGFVLIMAASTCSALRIVWSDRVLKGLHGLSQLHPVALLVYTMPIGLALLLVLFFVGEFRDVAQYVAYPPMHSALLVIRTTGPTTYAVTNVIKDVAVIFLGWAVFRNTITVVNVLGFVTDCARYTRRLGLWPPGRHNPTHLEINSGVLAVLSVFSYALDRQDADRAARDVIPEHVDGQQSSSPAGEATESRAEMMRPPLLPPFSPPVAAAHEEDAPPPRRFGAAGVREQPHPEAPSLPSTALLSTAPDLGRAADAMAAAYATSSSTNPFRAANDDGAARSDAASGAQTYAVEAYQDGRDGRARGVQQGDVWEESWDDGHDRQ